eukprot:TRINITY_DN49319_c0_g1_i1.p1 TRINITY_DN49319_c0_g1~~TRINITY_DN49319_c0_g1_i1.p1  ORF type:complete len:276 (+),score=41.01 TRINITY_DN49319_c0_g1_i1:188-1015(+)
MEPARRAATREDFNAAVAAHEPCVLRMSAVEALGWNPEMLAGRIGSEVVEVAEGVEEGSGATQKRQVEFDKFCSAVADPDTPPGGLYLKQASMMFERCPDLWSALATVRNLLPGEFKTPFFWMGSAGCVTGLHSDDENNVLAQIWGRKIVLLFPPSQIGALYPNDKYDSGTTCCDLDPIAPDLERHPNAGGLFRGEERYFEAVLDPGDVLYCPKGWFHHVRCAEPSISVNIFVSTWREWVWWGLPRMALECGHWLGLVGRGNCVCHQGPGLKSNL